MAAIDVGAAAIDRVSSTLADYTFIAKENPANLSGKITTIAVYVYNATLVGAKVATFQETSSNVFTARASQTLPDTTVGYHEIVVDLDVEAGDYIGIFIPSDTSRLDKDSTADGYWTLVGDQTACTDATFTFTAERSISLYGTGETPAGWSGKVAGVTDPAKVLGVAKANIKSVMGVE